MPKKESTTPTTPAQFRLRSDGTKQCKVCLTVKPAEEFYGRKRSVDGLTNDCRGCHRERNWARYHTVPGKREESIARSQRWLAENRTRRKAYRVNYQAEHKERLAAERRAAYAADPERFKAYERNRAARDPEFHKKANLRSYGLTVEAYAELLASQNGTCAICGGPPNGRAPTLHVDHSHVTGEVRGLLCHSCNTALGHFRDDPINLQRAIDYLTARQSKETTS